MTEIFIKKEKSKKLLNYGKVMVTQIHGGDISGSDHQVHGDKRLTKEFSIKLGDKFEIIIERNILIQKAMCKMQIVKGIL